jgi:hypothetical protein
MAFFREEEKMGQTSAQTNFAPGFSGKKGKMSDFGPRITEWRGHRLK